MSFFFFFLMQYCWFVFITQAENTHFQAFEASLTHLKRSHNFEKVLFSCNVMKVRGKREREGGREIERERERERETTIKFNHKVIRSFSPVSNYPRPLILSHV